MQAEGGGGQSSSAEVEGLGGSGGCEGAVFSAVWAEGGGGPSSCGIISMSLVQELQSSGGAPLSLIERSELEGGGRGGTGGGGAGGGRAGGGARGGRAVGPFVLLCPRMTIGLGPGREGALSQEARERADGGGG